MISCLYIETDSFDLLIALLRAFTFPSLDHIVAETRDLVYGAVLRCFAETLAARSSALRTRMHTVDLRLSDRLPHAPPKNDVDTIPVYRRAELAPLFALSALRRVVIRGRCFVALDNAALATVARAWPHATRFKFEPAHRSKEVAAVLSRLQQDHPECAYATLAGLLHIAERCHEQGALALMLDLASLPSTAELWRALEPLNIQGAPPCPLRKLSVGWSRIGDHVRLASALSAWFPALVVIKPRGVRRCTHEMAAGRGAHSAFRKGACAGASMAGGAGSGWCAGLGGVVIRSTSRTNSTPPVSVCTGACFDLGMTGVTIFLKTAMYFHSACCG